MSQEKTERNKRMWKDHEKGMTVRKLMDKYTLKRNTVVEILARLEKYTK